MKRLTFLALVLIVMACGGAPAGETESADAPADPDTVILAAADTIGAEMGESPDVFAFIIDAAHTPEGNVAVLDAGRKSLKVFSPGGDLVMNIGGSGPGPGEYLMPMGLAVTDMGYVVSDMSGAKLVRYGLDGQFTDEITGFFPIPPARISGSAEGRFLAADFFMDLEGEGGPAASFDFVSFLDDSEPEFTFATYPLVFAGGMINSDEAADLAFAAGPGGEAYLVERSDTAFVLLGFTAQGEEFLSIREEHDRIPLTEEELQEEEMAISLTIENGETNLSTDRRPTTSTHRMYIDGVGVDGEGRIWVEMGDELETYFRVYSPEGDLLMIALPDGSIQDDARYAITPFGMLAYDGDPDDWPKLYLLEVR